MSTGLSTNNPTVVAAFHAALLHQGLLAVLIVGAVAVTWNVLRAVQWRRGGGVAAPPPPAAPPEPAARRLLRIGFGVIWIVDGILQGQAAMPLGLVPEVIQPTASASPAWVQAVVDVGTSVWNYHPVSAAAAAVWLQVGIGVWLVVAPRGALSRLGGAASVGWGLVVWIFGEAFGGVFTSGQSWLFGTPGAALFYCAAGVLIALPERVWSTRAVARVVLRAMGLFFLGMAVLQAWPGRGSWEGRTRSGLGSLTSMVQQMAQTPQPRWLSSWLVGFGRFDASHGWAVNLFVVVALAAIGAGFLTARAGIVRIAAVAGVVLCVATWVLVQDLGFLGGIGTDPNSMLPLAVVFLAGWLALTPAREGGDGAVVPITARAPQPPWRERLATSPTYALRLAAALGALGIVLIGAVPMAAAATRANADPILIQAVDGPPEPTDVPAPPFRLVDQYGRPVSLTSLHGKTVVLTFLDDVCTSVCPIIAQELRGVDRLLGPAARRVALVAINANPRFTAPEYLAAFDRQEALADVPNWIYLTGSLPQLKRVWSSYGIVVETLPGGAMIGHSLYVSVIDASGHTRYVLSADPGPGTQATQSSFSVTLEAAVRSVLRSR